jgi:hypothetical protein
LELGESELGRALDPEIRERILALGAECGFAFVALDLRGYRRGALSSLVPVGALAAGKTR